MKFIIIILILQSANIFAGEKSSVCVEIYAEKPGLVDPFSDETDIKEKTKKEEIRRQKGEDFELKGKGIIQDELLGNFFIGIAELEYPEMKSGQAHPWVGFPLYLLVKNNGVIVGKWIKIYYPFDIGFDLITKDAKGEIDNQFPFSSKPFTRIIVSFVKKTLTAKQHAEIEARRSSKK